MALDWPNIFIVAAAGGALLWLVGNPFRLCRAVCFVLCHTVIRLRIDGPGGIPAAGAALLVANHVAFFDALMILAATPRRVRFMVHEDFFKPLALRLFFRYIGVLQVPSGRHPRAVREFFETVQRHLTAGEMVCVFPEGGVSDNGLLQQFKTGVRAMLPPGGRVPVIPIRLGMLWGRLFTLHRGRVRFIPPRRLPILVSVTIGAPAHPKCAFELRQIISRLGAESEKRPFPGELPLHAEFARRARRHPFGVTFKDFEAKPVRNFALLLRALIFSRLIRQADPGPDGGYVGVMLPNCLVLNMTLLAVLFADRTPTVLNYTAGRDALKQAADRAKLRLTLTSRKFLAKLNLEPTPEMVFLEDLVPRVTRSLKFEMLFNALLPLPLLLRRVSPQSGRDVGRQAVLLFSSGSTGKPKGVMLTHRNINSNILSFWRGINWSPEDRIIGSLPLFHAYGFTVCFAFPAISGTRSVFLPNILDAGAVVRLLEAEAITLMITTPTFLQSYMRKAQPHHLRTLRLVITGAEKLRSDIAASFKRLTGLSIVEGYGCTELSPIVSVNLARSFLALGRQAGRPDSVGAPMPGIHVRIVDPETGEELPPDTPGMLTVEGALVMAGYLDDPEATAAVLQNGAYRTGDIAAMSEDGYITITGRQSRFSKIAGEMVPHELVERAIAELVESDGRCVAVTGRSDPKRGERLLVFYSLEALDPAAVVAGLREKKLPNLWIPRREDFRRLDHLPLLGSGKLDLQHLKRLAAADTAAAE